MTDIQATMVGDRARPGKPNPRNFSLWKPFLAFLLFALVISLAGSIVFHRYKESIKSDKQNELGGIADLKTRQIINWMAERKASAQVLKGDSLFVETVERWLTDGAPDGATKGKLQERLASLQKANDAFGVTAISLFDSKASLRLSSSADETPVRDVEKQRLLESMRSGVISFSDIHIHRESRHSGERIEIELSAPLTLVKNGKVRNIGVVLFRINPNYFLFPLISRWPTPSESAENILVRREGDEVVYLNELRYDRSAPLTLRFPTNTVPVAGGNGRNGTVRMGGRDGLSGEGGCRCAGQDSPNTMVHDLKDR